MKIYLQCYKCGDNKRYPSGVSDNGIYDLTCDADHEVSICLQQLKFEQLYEISLNAIIDGYYRDAVASMNAAIERFQEFYIQFSMCKKNRLDVYDQAWKKVSSQSERQLGAYIFLYTMENSELPPTLSNSKVTFRNSVVHKGEFPSYEKTIEFCKNATDVILPVLSTMKKDWDCYRAVRAKDMTQKYDSTELSENVHLVSPASLLETIEYGCSFDEALSLLENTRSA